MVETLTTLLLLGGLLAWIARRSSRRRPGRFRGKDIDREELEAAEREVRDLGASRRPEEEVEGDDWGPGAPRAPLR